jgi:hypothetical protein
VAFPALAQADSYCVSDPACVTAGGHDEAADLQKALDDAAGTDAADTVHVGAGSFASASTNGFTYSTAKSGNMLDLVGAGSAQTTLTGANSTTTTPSTTLHVDVPPGGSSITDLAVQLPGNTGGCCGFSTGIEARTVSIQRVNVTTPNAIVSGQAVEFAGELVQSTVSIPDNVGGAVGARVQDGLNGLIQDSTVSGYYGIYADGQPTVRVQRTRITASAGGIYALGSDVTAEDSLIQMTSGIGVRTGTTTGSDGTTTLRSDTLIGPTVGIEAAGDDTGRTATINLDSLVIHQAGTSLARIGSPGTADVTAKYSNYPASSTLSSGTGTLTESPGDTHFADPKFVDAGNGDYRLRFDSPLIDLGNPSTVFKESATDLAGAPRFVDADGDAKAQRDMGAFEYQRKPPSASATASPATVQTGEAVTFDGSGSSDPDPGDVLTYSWSFDDGTTASGSVVSHAFSTPGGHTGTLTVTDPTGQQATAQATTTVETPPAAGAPGNPNQAPAPTILSPLVVGRVSVFPATWRLGSGMPSFARVAPVGTTISFNLSRAAKATLAFSQARPGRKVGRRCLAPSRRNAGRPRCTRYAPAGSLSFAAHAGLSRVRFQGRLSRRRSLKPGRYRVVVSAIDASGSRSTPRNASFTALPHAR